MLAPRDGNVGLSVGLPVGWLVGRSTTQPTTTAMKFFTDIRDSQTMNLSGIHLLFLQSQHEVHICGVG